MNLQQQTQEHSESLRDTEYEMSTFQQQNGDEFHDEHDSNDNPTLSQLPAAATSASPLSLGREQLSGKQVTAKSDWQSTKAYNYKSSRCHQVLKTIAGVGGNVLEWYDFAVFGFFSDIIGDVFFPRNQSEDASTMES